MYNQVLNQQDRFNYTEPLLLYFDVSDDQKRSSYYYEESLFHNLPIRLLLRDERINEGCIGTFYRGIDDLEKLIAVRTEVKGFVSQGQCISKSSGGNTVGVFYKPENFFAFKIKGRELIDIKQEVLGKIGL